MSRIQDAAVLAEKRPVTDEVVQTVSETPHFLLFRRIMTFAGRAHWKRAVLFWMRFAANPLVTFRWWWFLVRFSAERELPLPHDDILQKPLSKFLINKVSRKRRLAFLMDNFAIADRHFPRSTTAGLWAGKTMDMGTVRGRNDEYRCILALADRCGGRHEGALAVRLVRDHDNAVLWTATFTFLAGCETQHHTIVVGGMQGPRAAKEQMVSVTRDLSGLRPKEAALMVLQGLACEGALSYFAVAQSRHPIRYRRARRQKMMVSDIDAFWRERSGEPDKTFGFKVPFSSLEGRDKRSHMKLSFFNLGKRFRESKATESAQGYRGESLAGKGREAPPVPIFSRRVVVRKLQLINMIKKIIFIGSAVLLRADGRCYPETMQQIDSPDLLDAFLNVKSKLAAAIYHRVRCHATTFDLVQDTFLRLWERRKLLGLTGDLCGYVIITGRNLAIDHERRKRIAPVFTGIEHLAFVADPSPTQETCMIGRQELERLQMLVDALPPRCRDVFLLSRIEGLTFVEIGQRLHISPKTAFGHMVTALEKLKSGMTPPGER